MFDDGVNVEDRMVILLQMKVFNIYRIVQVGTWTETLVWPQKIFFNKILEKCSGRQLYPDPTSFHIDFEKSVINAVKSVIGEHVCINGCFYHLTQSPHRMIQKLGL